MKTTCRQFGAALLAAASVACSVSALLPTVANAADATFVATAQSGQVTVEQGDLLGFVQDGIYTYRGVPYAKAARFKAPEPADKWSGVRLAMNYGEICPIPSMNAVSKDEQFNSHRYWPESETCQFLNIWTPGIKDSGKRPVLVFLHGGGFTNGSSIEGAGYEGGNLARLGDMVVVSLNHRLNVLGTLDLSSYGNGYVGNPGMRDIVAALRWVQKNIAEFGGDPSNVTIMGQSGGGGKVRFLMGAPAAEPLFGKAIVMSGAGNVAAYPQDTAKAIADQTVANLGLTKDTITQIESKPYEEVLAAGTKAMAQVTDKLKLQSAINWRPTVDGDLMPADPVSDGWEKYSANKPLLVGNVMNEMQTVIGNDNAQLLADNWNNWSKDTATERISAKYGEKAASLAAAWSEAYPHRPLGELAVADFGNRTTSLAAASWKAAHGSAPVYNYLFAWNSPVLDGIAGAWHVADVPMAFFSVDLIPQAFGGGEAARSMSFDVSRAFIAFAKTGNPNHPGLPEWPAYTAENGATLVFDDYSIVGLHHDKTLLDVFNGTK